MKAIFKKHIWLIALVCFIAFLDSFVLALLPVITKYLIDSVNNLSLELILKFGALYVANVVLILAAEYLSKISNAFLERKTRTYLKDRVFCSIFSMPYQDFFAQSSEYYLNIFIEDVKNVCDDYIFTLIELMRSIIFIAVYFAVMLSLNYIMAIAIVAVGFLSLLIPKLTGKKLASSRKAQSDANALYVGKLKDLLEGFDVNTPKTFKPLTEEHQKANANREYFTYKYARQYSFVNIFGGLSFYIINIVVFILGALLIYFKGLEVGSFVALTAFTELLIIPVRDMVYQAINLNSSKQLVKKLKTFIDKKEYSKPQIKSFAKAIWLSGISYQAGNFKLSDIDMTFEKGKKYAVIGGTGSGKTTLLKLILGALHPLEGSVRIDGCDIKNFDTSEIMAYISQRTFIFNASGADNISLYGSFDVKKIESVVTEISAQSLMERSLGEHGSSISGGERNKIAILRALAKGADILLCDEMFSGLDDASKKEISGFLFNSKQTIISVTHDISKEHLSNYDEIIFIGGGRVVKKFTSVDADTVKTINSLLEQYKIRQ